jgi:crotonobetainyl-CoA:carnitine CoA-transferase CaiB-like acyl-CoA transferase
MPAPLEGITVLDFTRYQNGPHATVMLSDMGARVIKVERPHEGDPGRWLGRQEDGFCGYFEALDRGKESITIDLSTDQGKEIVYRLAARVDVVTENFRTGVMDRLGLGYEMLRERNPRIIYAMNSGFGPEGPMAALPSFDIVAQGVSGAMATMADADGRPIQIPWGLADQVGSMVFAYGIVTGIAARELHGVGQRIDVSQMGAMATLQTLSIVRYLHTGEQAARFNNPVFTAYEGSDGLWLTIGVLTPQWWEPLCTALDRLDLTTDDRFAEPFARLEHREELRAELASTFRTRQRDEWLVLLAAQDVPSGPVHDYAAVASEPQFWDNDYLVEIDHPLFERHRTVGIPVAFSETPARVQGPAPELGNATASILGELGYDTDAIADLAAAEVI